MARSYPLSVYDMRSLPEGYEGPVYVWDVDKTYLVTHFSSARGLARIPVEFAVDKTAIPGMPEILRGLRKGPGPEYACAPLYFVTASPPQLRKVLENKMLLDGVEYDGITTKNWIRTFLELRPGRLREQTGFKLCALLTGRKGRPLAEEYLFGDDVENDPRAFYLYARLIGRRLSSSEAEKRMIEEGVKKDDRKHILTLLEELPDKLGEVKRIFIHLESKTPPSRIEGIGDLLVAVDGACQMGLALFELGLIDSRAVQQACRAVGDGGNLDKLIQDAISRRLISEQNVRALAL